MSGSIEVLSPGLFATVQDLGRPGYGAIGVSACGAADPVALRVGNRLVGNAEGAAALEMTLVGGSFRFGSNAVIALAGAALERAPMWTSFEIGAGEVLRCGRMASGARTYLCVRGGIAAPLVLGSASTHVPSGIGGGPLRRGDVLDIGPACEGWSPRRVRRSALEALAARKTLRVTPGPQHALFGGADVLTASSWRVTEECDRLGLRLAGPAIAGSGGGHMTTEGVSLGAIQVPANGQPIILFVDQQTTGGYPVIANVISADLPSVGQLRPGDEVRFVMVSFEEARRLLFEREALLRSEELLW
jgi:biotin-dependent carboxylase-like uncharacterized protein